MKGAAGHDGRGDRPEGTDLLRTLDAGLSPALLERALTHRSFAYENGGLPTNERLEFLGDAVLGLVVTDALFRGYPDLPEGHLAKLRAAVVNQRALAGVARGLRLGDFVRLGRGEEGTGGRDKASILADTLEAVIGAVYIERGLTDASALVHRLFDPVIASSARLGAQYPATTSSGHAHSDGYPDGGESCEQVLAHFNEIAEATDVPLNADFEDVARSRGSVGVVAGERNPRAIRSPTIDGDAADEPLRLGRRVEAGVGHVRRGGVRVPGDE